MRDLKTEERAAANLLRCAEYPPEEGLPEELFLLASALVPLPNVDLLVTDSLGRILLSRRVDAYYGTSWHIPGGCMRYGETFLDRLQATAEQELGCQVRSDGVPLAVRNVIRGPNSAQEHPLERGHNVALLFRCFLPDGYQIQNGDKTEQDDGFLRWFSRLPPDFLKIQHVFDDILAPWMTKEVCV